MQVLQGWLHHPSPNPKTLKKYLGKQTKTPGEVWRITQLKAILSSQCWKANAIFVPSAGAESFVLAAISEHLSGCWLWERKKELIGLSSCFLSFSGFLGTRFKPRNFRLITHSVSPLQSYHFSVRVVGYPQERHWSVWMLPLNCVYYESNF